MLAHLGALQGGDPVFLPRVELLPWDGNFLLSPRQETWKRMELVATLCEVPVGQCA